MRFSITLPSCFNGFSYADISAELGITNASLHYHFAGKADLGRALIERYSAAFAEALAHIDASGVDAPAQLQQYTQLYADVLSDGRMCLCGMLAAEYTTLPDPMKKAIRRFFDDNEAAGASRRRAAGDSGMRASQVDRRLRRSGGALAPGVPAGVGPPAETYQPAQTEQTRPWSSPTIMRMAEAPRCTLTRSHDVRRAVSPHRRRNRDLLSAPSASTVA